MDAPLTALLRLSAAQGSKACPYPYARVTVGTVLPNGWSVCDGPSVIAHVQGGLFEQTLGWTCPKIRTPKPPAAGSG